MKPGFHTTVREPKRANFKAPALQDTTKIQRKDPHERKDRMKLGTGEETKRAKFWAVRRRVVQGSAATKQTEEGEVYVTSQVRRETWESVAAMEDGRAIEASVRVKGGMGKK